MMKISRCGARADRVCTGRLFQNPNVSQVHARCQEVIPKTRQVIGHGRPAQRELPAAFLPKGEESKLGRFLVETVILLPMYNQNDAAKILRDAAQTHKVRVNAISAAVKQERESREEGSTQAEGQRTTESTEEAGRHVTLNRTEHSGTWAVFYGRLDRTRTRRLASCRP